MMVTRESAWEVWILYVLKAVEETSNWTKQKIAAIRQLLTHTTEYVREKQPKVYSRELVDLIFEMPYCRIADVIEAGLARRQAASRHLKALVEIGVLQEMQLGREKVFIHPKLMQLLTHDSVAFSHFGRKTFSRRAPGEVSPSPKRTHLPFMTWRYPNTAELFGEVPPREGHQSRRRALSPAPREMRCPLEPWVRWVALSEFLC
jgi:hypothetical protein